MSLFFEEHLTLVDGVNGGLQTDSANPCYGNSVSCEGALSRV